MPVLFDKYYTNCSLKLLVDLSIDHSAISSIMVTTRNQAESGDSSRQAAAGEKHEVETENASPQPKRAKTEKQSAGETPAEPETPAKSETPAAPKDEEMQDGTDGANGTEDPKQSTTDSKTQRGDAVRPSEEKDVPSNVLEKGIIHFFVRGRVNVEEPSGVNDIARSFILLRPIAKDAKLGDGTIQDSENTRLLMLPKKVIPQSGKDRFMAFVEKPKASYDDLKESFLAGNDYQTKTAGTRHTPAATPVGEGVYAITSTGRESHLVYILTLPETLGSAQAELGLKNRDSFIISTRNPKFEAPGNARLPKGPEFSKE